jgi:histidine phosphotransferase ChpT
MTDGPDLAALIGSRICHDLISPIGAIGNGVELLMMDGGARSPELALVSESVVNANARIRFFRVAFGAASRDQRIGRQEVTSILSDVGRGGRLAYDWSTPADLPRNEVKLALLASLCLETAMAYGGRITVTASGVGEAPMSWTLRGEAQKLRLDPALWSVLTAPAAPPELAPGQVHFALAPDEARRQGRSLGVELGETAIRLRF